MLSEAAITSALARAGIEASVRFDEVTASTQDTALELAAEGAPEWTFVGAGHQTEGRGRLGRTWVDRPGGSLLFSFVLRPAGLRPAEAGVLGLLAGSAMAEAGSELAGFPVRCKWPNDLLAGDRKVGGILARSEVVSAAIEFVVIGVGVNLGELPEGVEGASSLPGVDAARLLERFASSFARAYSPATESFAADVVDGYRPWCATLGRRVRVRTAGGDLVEGPAADIDLRGALVVDGAGGPVAIGFGEVVHVDR